MKSSAGPLHPAWDINHLFVHHVHAVRAPCPLLTEEPSGLSERKRPHSHIFITA